MVELLGTVKEAIQNIHPLVVYLILFLVGLYVYWRGCIESRKNISSVFDTFVFSAILSVAVGRIVYIAVEWETFSSFIWYWLPYEKYGEKVYLFRLLPWRFLSIWDGGLVILAVFVSILLFLTFFVLVIKKWNWKHLFFPIYFSSITMLGLSFIYIGINSGFYNWIYHGLILISILGILYLLYKFIYRVIKNPKLEKYVLGYVGLISVWVSSIYISYLYFISDLTLLEDVLVGIFIIWSLSMGVFFVIDLKKARIQISSVSALRSV